ncbi:MAG: hypothetical protein ACLRFE_04215 [Clostridia bacterium]
MEFLKRMKSRDTIEMSLKTIMAVIAGFIVIILMEGMIFSIYMNKINQQTGAGTVYPTQCVAYCEQLSDDEYKVYLHDDTNGMWRVLEKQTKAQIEDAQYEEVLYRTPNAFDVSITNTHYIVMSVFIAGILGFYGFRFYRLFNDYKKYEKRYKKTGKIFA